MKRNLFFVLMIFVLLLAACAPKASQDQVDDIVQGTFQALTAQANPAATAVPANSGATTGSIAGELSFPSEGVPPLVIVAFNTTTGHYYWLQYSGSDMKYQLDNIPPGAYHVFAYNAVDKNMVGAYDQYVLCGMQASCTDMSLADVVVQAGSVTPNINPANWYGDSKMYPPLPDDPNMPGFGEGFGGINGSGSGDLNAGPGVGVAGPGPTGSISGALSYPSSVIPHLKVVAFNISDYSEYYYVSTSAGQSVYQIDFIPPGIYVVVAYTTDGVIAGGFTQAVPCGLSVNCADHSLVPVMVEMDRVEQNINPQDWYAPPNFFPAMPAQ